MTLYGWDASDFDWPRGPVDLVAARSDGIDFFTHKATEGTRWVHGHCGEAMNRARAAGIPFIGTYMVPRTPGNGGNGPVEDQVDYFLYHVNQMVPWWQHHPGWFWQMDTEHWYDDTGNLYDAVPPTVGAQACQLLADKTGRKVLHYAPHWSYGNKVPGGEPLWASVYPAADNAHFRTRYAEIHGDRGMGWEPYSGRTPAIWQYTAAATIGRQPRCDANAFRGTLNDFAAMIGALAVDSYEEDDEMALLSNGELTPGFAMDENGVWIDRDAITGWTSDELGEPADGAGALAGYTEAHLSLFRDAAGGPPVKVRVVFWAAGWQGPQWLTFDGDHPRHYLSIPPGTTGISMARVRQAADDTTSEAAIAFGISAKQQ